MGKTNLATKYSKYFPLKGEITADIIQKADISDTSNCIGALTLKAALGDKLNPEEILWNYGFWGNINGDLYFVDGSYLILGTTANVRMMQATPQEVTFIVL